MIRSDGRNAPDIRRRSLVMQILLLVIISWTLTLLAFRLNMLRSIHVFHSDEETCPGRMEKLSKYVRRYAEVHNGVLPGRRIKDKNNGQVWAHDMIRSWESAGADLELLRQVLRCPEDPRDTITSYNLNLSGMHTREIPDKLRDRKILLYEQDFEGSHGNVCAFSGRTGLGVRDHADKDRTQGKR